MNQRGNILNRASGMQFSLGRYVGGMSFFGRRERPETLALAIRAYVRPEFLIVPRRTKKAGGVIGVGRSLVLEITESRCFAEIGVSIVRFIAVDVVKVLFRKRTVNVEPCQAVCAVQETVHAQMDITTGCQRTGYLSDFAIVRVSDSPSENASLRIVVKKFAQALRGKIGFAHAVALSRQWLREVTPTGLPPVGVAAF